MPFVTVQPVRSRVVFREMSLILREDNWNDWGRYKTMYTATLFDGSGQRYDLGSVKIGQRNMGDRQRPNIPTSFDTLDDSFFSLGQTDGYYEELNRAGPDLRRRVLLSLRDIANDEQILQRHLDEDVMHRSLLRSVTLTTVRGQLRRMTQGYERLTPYHFSYSLPPFDTSGETEDLDFAVRPESQPPTNIHVVIGRNGVGKTRLLKLMATSLCGYPSQKALAGDFSSLLPDESAPTFANVIYASFSAFDRARVLLDIPAESAGIRFSYVGLQRRSSDNNKTSTKTPTALRMEFVDSLTICRQASKRDRWNAALATLASDPQFHDAAIQQLLSSSRGNASLTDAGKLFDQMSSGHKIVLLIVSRLVALVEQGTLLLVDEPEAHLHPPLLSALVRALSDLLVYRNGVAVIATHSPVVLQEVPRTCVWKLRRIGERTIAERPEAETFGESIGVLTRDVFGLEVTAAGFHRLIEMAVDGEQSYETLYSRFEGQLGSEARAVAAGLLRAAPNGQ